MSDLKKMLEALECHFKNLGEENCSECQYECRGASWVKVQYQLCLDLIETLTPRVMSLDDVVRLHPNDVVWIQERDEPEAYPGIFIAHEDYFRAPIRMKVSKFMAKDSLLCGEDDSYGVDWFCWTQKPSIEQQEGVKWGG